MKKRILIFSYAYEPLIGGAEIAVKELTERLGSDFIFDMVTRRFSRGALRAEKIDAVSVHRIGGGKLLFSFLAALKGLSLHRRNRYDGIWAIMANRAGFAALFFKLFHQRVPFVLTLQEGDPIPYIMRQVGVFYPFFKMIFTRANTVTAISNYLANWAKKMGAKSVVVVPNGVNIAKFQSTETQNTNKTQNTKTIITTSRLVPKNGVGDLIEAMRYLPAHYKLLIVGSGSLEKVLKFKVESEKLKDRITFAGEVAHDELPRLLWASDIFCRPSLSEGMGISFIEAMAVGLPVIATPIGGVPDFLKNKETGLFCKVNNPKSIAETVLLLDDQPALREAIIAAALRMVKEKYDWDILAEKMRAVFAELL
ncbi:MAG: glycosyltransferase family 4 protein [bacterium]|nr:glycosyltransferase family 4 protein [bacterium]